MNVWETGEEHTSSWWRELKERNYLEDLGLDGDSIKMDLQKVGWRGAWNGSIWPWIAANSGPRECGNGSTGSTQRREFLEDRGIILQVALYVRNRFLCSLESQTGLGTGPAS